MSARIKFEDLNGKPLGYVDQKGEKLSSSNDLTKALVSDFMTLRREATAEGFIEYYGDPNRRASHLYSKLVDSETDETDYPSE